MRSSQYPGFRFAWANANRFRSSLDSSCVRKLLRMKNDLAVFERQGLHFLRGGYPLRTGKLGDDKCSVRRVELERFFENLFDWPAHVNSLPQVTPGCTQPRAHAAVGASSGKHHDLGGSPFTMRNTSNIARTSASSRFRSGICDIVTRMSGNAFCSCSLDVFCSIPVRETVRDSSKSGELPAVRFPPPPPDGEKESQPTRYRDTRSLCRKRSNARRSFFERSKKVACSQVW